MKRKTTITLTPQEEREIDAILRSRTVPVGQWQRARIIKLWVEGIKTEEEIGEIVLMRRRHVTKWVGRFEQERMEGLKDKPGRGHSSKTTDQVED